MNQNQQQHQHFINLEYNPLVRGENEVLFSNKQIMFEQYKLLIDSAHKLEERRSGSNSVFLGINTLLTSFLVRPSQLFTTQIKDIIVLLLLSVIGGFISANWLKVTNSYRKLNTVNLLLIQKFEKFLPTKVFSLRAELEKIEDGTEQVDLSKDKANVILTRESFLPEVFILFYIMYGLIVVYIIMGY